ncbi:KTSC domain-containing protein [Hyphomicrobium facile]|nr:KTSC domain-containing protein [Hyphomicrobium facile]
MVKKMEFQKTSVIHAAEYDAASRTLDIFFSNGSCITYFGVPRPEYEGLVNADSVAEYFKTRIRGHYECEECVETRRWRSTKNAGTRRSRRTIH